MKFRLGIFLSIFGIMAGGALALGQRKPDADKPITGDFKITIKQTMSGQSSQNTTMIKGQRQREETSMSVGATNMSQVNITQCDLKRTIQINDSLRKYLITPMVEASEAKTAATTTTSPGGSTTRGGVVTMTVNTVDTGERKEMFGFTARHLKRTTIMDSSADACSQQKMKLEYDGWYINLEYGIACDTATAQMGSRLGAQGCRDRYQTRYTGPQRLGFPLMETMTMHGADGTATFTMTREVTEISRQTLDAALFDAPAGYVEAKTQEEMYATASTTDSMAATQPSASQPTTNPAATSTASTTARPKIGVVEFNNKAKASVSTDELRQQMVAVLNGHGVEAVALNATSASEAEIEAKAKGVTYILFTDISTYKSPSAGKKIGGLLGRATGVGSGDGGKAEAKFDYRLVPVGSTSPKLQSSASGKEETADASVNAALQAEARAVVSAVGGN
jgi:hypothetical protein